MISPMLHVVVRLCPVKQATAIKIIFLLKLHMDAEGACSLIRDITCIVTRPLIEAVTALNHPINHCNFASDQHFHSNIIMLTFSVSFDSNSAAS